jgi:hypothetical protein
MLRRKVAVIYAQGTASSAIAAKAMAWKLATGFVLTAETWLGSERTRSGEEAVLTIGVSQHERMPVIRRIRRTPAISFSPVEWLPEALAGW